MLLLRETIEGAVEKAISAEAPFCNVSMPFGQAGRRKDESICTKPFSS
ncbi:hypothetical protein [Anoxybacteroides rupiense]|nr:hypothetical protein [Anoxybacillus rupiensis]MBB3908610.1 hypothetical protein [Anoxybacillus rupiensis]